MLCENVLWSAHAFCVEPKLNGARLLCYVWHGVEYQQWCAPNAGFGETKFHYTLSHVVSPVPAYGMHTCDCVWALYKQKQNQTYKKKQQKRTAQAPDDSISFWSRWNHWSDAMQTLHYPEHMWLRYAKICKRWISPCLCSMHLCCCCLHRLCIRVCAYDFVVVVLFFVGLLFSFVCDVFVLRLPIARCSVSPINYSVGDGY